MYMYLSSLFGGISGGGGVGVVISDGEPSQGMTPSDCRTSLTSSIDTSFFTDYTVLKVFC